jgi:hypothetical protein
MPWAPKDAPRFTKAANTAKKRRQWAHVANSALQRCKDAGEDNCEARAIKQADAVVSGKNKARGEGQGVGGPRQGMGGPAYCVCPKCGHKAKHTPDIPCKSMKCPECGTAMESQEKANLGFTYMFGTPEGSDYITQHCICPDCGYEGPFKGVLCQETRCPKCGAYLIPKEQKSEHETSEQKSIPMRITKATVRSGRMYWQGAISDNDWDKEDERLSTEIFNDFEQQLTINRQKADYQPPFVSLSHYKRQEDGTGVLGTIENAWTEGSLFYSEGYFADTRLGRRVFEVVKSELERMAAGEKIENPVRFSIGFYPGQIAWEE